MEEPKQDHHNDSASKPPYSWRVLIIYSLFGPPLGTVLLLLGSGLTDPNPEQAFRLIPIAILFSYPVGGLPAFLTGLWAMLLRLKRNLPGIAAVTAAGALLSVICDAVMFDIPGSADNWIFLGCGAAAAFVLSAFLPKPPK
ncbi:hypothetical protein A7P85_02020 [Eikenella corrodens]|uniref:Uncharacterized protein n=2 Tax=Eikenella corrodens TaxID=539 RepID=A0A1A9RJA9_EIKCO|nr:hypothetical protein A7P85_02020 [Eikenella corrodens]OAM25294.1 hypothetical protein A7P92_01465 [Eikenella corrodens]